MTKQYLGRFIGRTIQFTIDGLPFLGVVKYNVWLDRFKIAYSVAESGRTRRGGIALRPAQIERITFDPEQNILTLLDRSASMVNHFD